jgi:hypothetical protein
MIDSFRLASDICPHYNIMTDGFWDWCFWWAVETRGGGGRFWQGVTTAYFGTKFDIIGQDSILQPDTSGKA